MDHKVAVILFPGSNCELEALRACRRSKLTADLIRWNDDYSKLKKYDAFILPGGFSYEDRGRSGIIAAQDPIMDVIKQQAEAGKPVLGLCNGCQILVEKGMIPGLNPNHLELAMGWNERVKKGKILGVGFYNDWIYIRHDATKGRSVFNRFSQKEVMRIPVAHGEGRFTTLEKNLLENLKNNEQTLFRYCDENGKIVEEFPVNPNGAMYNLAGVCNPEGNVLALMPHPERTTVGQPIFDSLADYLNSSKKTLVKPKSLSAKKITPPLPIQDKPEKMDKKPDITMLIRLIITDNEERTMENTVKRLGFKATLKRQIFLGFDLKDKKDLKQTAEKLLASGEILNLNKEIPTIYIGNEAYSYSKDKGLQSMQNQLPNNFHFIVTEYDNYTGKSIRANLQNHLHDNVIEKVERGVFWSMEAKDQATSDQIIKTHLFHNPHSMKLILADFGGRSAENESSKSDFQSHNPDFQIRRSNSNQKNISN